MYIHTYIHTDTACVQYVNVGLAQAHPNYTHPIDSFHWVWLKRPHIHVQKAIHGVCMLNAGVISFLDMQVRDTKECFYQVKGQLYHCFSIVQLPSRSGWPHPFGNQSTSKGTSLMTIHTVC